MHKHTPNAAAVCEEDPIIYLQACVPELVGFSDLSGKHQMAVQITIMTEKIKGT